MVCRGISSFLPLFPFLYHQSPAAEVDISIPLPETQINKPGITITPQLTGTPDQAWPWFPIYWRKRFLSLLHKLNVPTANSSKIFQDLDFDYAAGLARWESRRRRIRKKDMRLMAMIEASSMVYIVPSRVWQAGGRAFLLCLWGEVWWYIRGFASKSENLTMGINASNGIDYAYMKYKYDTKNRLGFSSWAIIRIDSHQLHLQACLEKRVILGLCVVNLQVSKRYHLLQPNKKRYWTSPAHKYWVGRGGEEAMIVRSRHERFLKRKKTNNQKQKKIIKSFDRTRDRTRGLRHLQRRVDVLHQRDAEGGAVFIHYTIRPVTFYPVTFRI